MSEMLIVVKYSGQSCIPHARGGYSTHQSKSTIRKHISSTFNILHLKQKPVFFATFILWCHVSLHLSHIDRLPCNAPKCVLMPLASLVFPLVRSFALKQHITTAANSALCRRRRNEDDLPFGIHWWVLVDIPQCLLELN
ncbi:unnamed protein product [Mesocestoides corti]|uniref:Uncharacterized protein n=1 Tax=Mesocestoides corti TaxID=53468 RepID=A0A0R3UPF4_MESCO|nr:unnamed protein product [Mesocestoides corti]